MTNPKISVIMPCTLDEYDGCAMNREQKLIRAIRSFLSQDYENKELIIVSDGCEKTIEIIKQNFSDYIDLLIFPFFIPKQPKFSGNVRDVGLKKAKGEIICYLDSDDMLGGGHLSSIVVHFDLKKYDWVYYNDYLQLSAKDVKVKFVELEHGSIGTSSIAHKNIRKPFYKPFGREISWKGCNGYGHDWKFIKRLIKKFPDNKKIYNAVYLICHMPNMFDY
jgi:glycosyltransferase involved in cell wall biosynthesis